MTARRTAAAALVMVLLLGAAMLARREQTIERAPEAEAALESASASPTEVSPAALPESATAVGTARPDSCRTLDMDVVATIEREGRVALEPTVARATLLASQDPEHLATAALLARDPADKVADIARAMTTGRRNPTVVWTAVLICDAAGANADCPAKEWEAALLELDGENSETWIHVAENRWQRGEIEEALEATQRAAAAAETRVYWADTVEMIERALGSTGGYSFPSRVVAAFGFAAANVPLASARLNMCKAQSKESPVWAEACLGYGRLAERRIGTDYGEVIAQAIQIAALEASGEDASDVIERRDRARSERNEAASHAGEAFVTTPAQLTEYLTTLRQKGERAAQRLLLEKASIYSACAREK